MIYLIQESGEDFLSSTFSSSWLEFKMIYLYRIT
jgi:hypothetical protein